MGIDQDTRHGSAGRRGVAFTEAGALAANAEVDARGPTLDMMYNVPCHARVCPGAMWMPIYPVPRYCPVRPAARCARDLIVPRLTVRRERCEVTVHARARYTTFAVVSDCVSDALLCVRMWPTVVRVCPRKLRHRPASLLVAVPTNPPVLLRSKLPISG